VLAVAAGTAGWGIAGAAWGHLAASLLFAGAFLGFVHGRTVPTGLRALLLRAYAPALAGVLAIGCGAALAGRLAARSAFDFAFVLAATAALLFIYGMCFVIDRDDRGHAWRRVKDCWHPVRGS
jgi:hypothetical protein